MAANVGIKIQDDEIVFGPMENVVLLVSGRIVVRNAKKAAGFIGHLGSSRSYIRIAPRAPESFHGAIVSFSG